MASILERYAKESNGHQSEFISCRIPFSEATRFKKHCQKLNLSVSEAVRLLIMAELENADSKKKVVPDQQTIQAKPTAAIMEQPKKVVAAVDDTDPKRMKSDRKYNSQFARFEDGKLYYPCPICDEWAYHKNLGRDHLKKHGYKSNTGLFRDYEEKALRMVAENKDI